MPMSRAWRWCILKSTVVRFPSRAYSNTRCPLRSMSNSCSAKPQPNSVCFLWGGGKAALIERPPVHMMSGSHPSDEVGKSYTLPVGKGRQSRSISFGKEAHWSAVSVQALENGCCITEELDGPEKKVFLDL